MCVRERECLCEGVSVCKRERERESACVCERERESGVVEVIMIAAMDGLWQM